MKTLFRPFFLGTTLFCYPFGLSNGPLFSQEDVKPSNAANELPKPSSSGTLYDLPTSPVVRYSIPVAPSIPHSFPTEVTLGARLGFLHSDKSIPLRIWNLPYGVWVEVAFNEGERVLYHHTDSTGLYPVDVLLTPDHEYLPCKLRVARSPHDFQKGTVLFEEELSLVNGSSVDFDYAREKGEQEAALSEQSRFTRFSRPNLPAPAVLVTTMAPSSALEPIPALSGDELTKLLKKALKFEPVDPAEAKGQFKIKFTGGNLSAAAVGLPGSARILKLTGEKKVLDVILKSLRLTAKGEFSVDNPDAGSPKTTVSKLLFELTFEPVVVKDSVASTTLTISPTKFQTAIEGASSEFLKESIPVKKDDCEATLTLSDIKITAGDSEDSIISDSKTTVVVHLMLSK